MDPCEILREVLLISRGSWSAEWADHCGTVVLTWIAFFDTFILPMYSEPYVSILDKEGLIFKGDVSLE